MKPDREQCLRWAEGAGLITCASRPVSGETDELEALCRTVWNAALEEAAKKARNYEPDEQAIGVDYASDEILKIKVPK